MNKLAYMQNLVILATFLGLTFGIWHLTGEWKGAWSAVLFIFWLSPSGRKCKDTTSTPLDD